MVSGISIAAGDLNSQLKDLIGLLGKVNGVKVPIKPSVPGSLNVEVTVQGTSPVSGCRFVRKGLVSLVTKKG